MLKKFLVVAVAAVIASQSVIYASEATIEDKIALITEEIQAAAKAGATPEEVLSVVAEVLPVSGMTESKKREIFMYALGVATGIAGACSVVWYLKTPAPVSAPEDSRAV